MSKMNVHYHYLSAVIGIFVNMVFVFVEAGENRTLLSVDAGTGVSFIDLWNLANISTGSSGDNVYRSGLIDKVFNTNCPKELFFDLTGPNHILTIRFVNPLDKDITTWLTAQTIYQPFTTNVSQRLTPGEDAIFTVHVKGNIDDVYIYVYHPENTNPYPIYYHVNENSYPVNTNEINDPASVFNNTSGTLKIIGYYDTDLPTCNLSDTGTQTSKCDVLQMLNVSNAECGTSNSEETSEQTPTSHSTTTVTPEQGSATELTSVVQETIGSVTESTSNVLESTSADLMTSTTGSVTQSTLGGLEFSTGSVTETTSTVSETSSADLNTSTNGPDSDSNTTDQVPESPSTTGSVTESTSVDLDTLTGLETSSFSIMESTSNKLETSSSGFAMETTSNDQETSSTTSTTDIPNPVDVSTRVAYSFYKMSDNSTDSFQFTGHVTWTAYYSSILQCALGCHLDATLCGSFYYSKTTGVCGAVKESSNASVVNVPQNARHYRLVFYYTE